MIYGSVIYTTYYQACHIGGEWQNEWQRTRYRSRADWFHINDQFVGLQCREVIVATILVLFLGAHVCVCVVCIVCNACCCWLNRVSTQHMADSIDRTYIDCITTTYSVRCTLYTQSITYRYRFCYVFQFNRDNNSQKHFIEKEIFHKLDVCTTAVANVAKFVCCRVKRKKKKKKIHEIVNVRICRVLTDIAHAMPCTIVTCVEQYSQ